jgi:hypothetical protein
MAKAGAGGEAKAKAEAGDEGQKAARLGRGVIINAVAMKWMKPRSRLRPPSPANQSVKPIPGVPGSPIKLAVAKMVLKPTGRVRPPSPAIDRMMPTWRLPGSPFQTRCGRQDRREAQLGIATAEPGQISPDAHVGRAGLTYQTEESMQGTMLIFLPNKHEPEVIKFSRAPDLGDFKEAIGGGWIESVPHFNTIEHDGKLQRCIAFCDEEGKLNYRTSGKTASAPDPTNSLATILWDKALRRAGFPGLMTRDGAVADYLRGRVCIVFGDDEFMENL